MGEDIVPAGHSSRRGGAGWEPWNDQVWCSWGCGCGGVTSEGLQDELRPRIENSREHQR